MKRLLLDTSIYGEVIFDNNSVTIIECLHNNVVVHGFKIIRDELRQTPSTMVHNNHKIRMGLLTIYDYVIKKNYELNEQIKQLAEEYFQAYKKFGGSKGKHELLNDLLIVACASAHQIDIVASEDNKTMLSENALKAYQLVNNISKMRNPEFIGYLKLKKWLI